MEASNAPDRDRPCLLSPPSLIAAETILLGAQTQSTSLTVNANVVKNCTITTAPVAFGNYDSGRGQCHGAARRHRHRHGRLHQRARRPRSVWAPAATRKAPCGGWPPARPSILTYELYKDTGHATVWGDTADTALDLPAAPNRNPRNFTVYGRVAAAQDATVGNYTDTVVATVNF